MTSKFSIDNRELLQRISSGEAVVGIDFGNLIVRELAVFRLAAMDSEPVIIVGDDGGDALAYRRLIQSFEPGTKLYRHAQPAPVVSAELLHTAASAIEDLLTTKDRTGAFVWFDLPFRLRSAANAQPVTVVPDDVRQALSKMDDEIIAELDAEESACRAAMLNGGKS
ncbi:hypothetical protein S13e_00037 [Klebsiella phage VLCpiS13e]|uniref:hypothetical protein n=1 Tax=Klebsiella phage VLCpiS13e TaxID=2874889 RepID=UPI00233F2853|nr:hypothetical protein PRB82_gp37 [Klebsiella phage VLCpiS13e]UVX31623.1 hypothetical protein S13e_00037 [Klebsiella phage VLCpiS13e]